MIRFAIGIETIHRPNENYLEQTVGNMRRAGVFVSPHLASFNEVHGEGKTRQQNGRDVIARAVLDAKLTGADWVMKLEDDLDFTDQFLENVANWLEDFGHAHTCMFSLGASFETVSHSRFANGEQSIFDAGTSFPTVREYIRRVEHCVPHSVRGYWGAQALVFRLADAEELVEFLGDDPALFDGKMYHRNRGHDLLLQTWGVHRGVRSFAVAVPSFVQHIGRDSNLSEPAIGHTQPFFQFPFAGHEYRYERVKVHA